ncbi:MAG: hypothetical protein HC860_05460 [Alkalinema sp. RU_4_3]|nr:hypothetical protein [Alkalinema sp. RU_4_3]
MSQHEIDGEQVQIHWRPRETETLTLKLPKSAIASLQKVAKTKDMSVDALLKFYISQSLRCDLSNLAIDQTSVIEDTSSHGACRLRITL